MGRHMWRGHGGGGAPPAGFDYYAAPAGSPTGSGAIGSPWDLQTALNGGYPGGTLTAGKKVGLRGGTYTRTGNFTTGSLSATALNPIKFQQYPGEQPTIDANFDNSLGNHDPGLVINDSYVWVIGLEITNSKVDRYNPTPGPNPTDQRNAGIQFTVANSKAINCILHDGGGAIGSNYGSEYYGNLCYYSGWTSTDGGHGHNGYIHGDNVVLKNNIYFDDAYPNDNCNIQMYGSGAAEFNNALVEGELYIRGRTLFGGLEGFNVLNSTVNACYEWENQFDGGYFSLDLTGSIIQNCYMSSSTGNGVFASPRNLGASHGLDAQGSTFIGNLDPSSGQYCPSNLWPNNTYIPWASRPGTTVSFVLPNIYETNRGTIIIFNWAGSSSVSVDLSSAVANGTVINIFNVQNFFASPVYSGTYNGGTVSIPMTGLTRVNGIGYTPPGVWSPDFGAFIVRAQGA